ncbi:hypothetical protein CC78DRAFT_575904 [Lojkania enalia]|uniref:BRCT domain-containing protein n=1 Tax=Lojkania enalia TaxID=147567 RepID=A0A9P4KHR9_9PLEO|nr:hypothetical protein CC78DRAFT_575904 [Didymosphaeria enalia]
MRPHLDLHPNFDSSPLYQRASGETNQDEKRSRRKYEPFPRSARSPKTNHLAATRRTPQAITVSTETGTAQTSCAAFPATRAVFDPWNSSSTGHQRAENRLSGSTSWRESRSLRLGEQFRGGLGGGRRVAHSVGARSEGFGKDERLLHGGWVKGVKGLREAGQKSLMESWGVKKASRVDEEEKVGDSKSGGNMVDQVVDTENVVSGPPGKENAPKRIFDGLCFYLNGSTAPLVSDHKLKHLIVEHGGNMSIGHRRRTVTHIILGATSSHGGAGGGLAGSKIHREMARARGKAARFVTAEWVVESIKAEKRLPEARFPALNLAPKGQNNVFGLFRPTSSSKGASASG